MASLSRATWVGPPAHWAAGRQDGGRRICYAVIHVTDGAEGPTSAEDGAAYDKRRPDSVSTHLFVDSNSAVREVQDRDTAYAAFPKGNAIGVQVEICGRADQTTGQWADPASVATLNNAAREVAQLCIDHGLPVVHLSVDQTRAAWYGTDNATRPRGIVSHYDVTRAYPEDGGSHSDPGPNFPWSSFLAQVSAYVNGGSLTREVVSMRYAFDSSWNDLPAALKPTEGGLVPIVTSGLGDYRVQDVSYQLNECVDDASGGTIKVLTRGSGHHQMPPAWDFSHAFSELTGGCVFSGDQGLAPWRMVSAGGVVADHNHSVAVTVSGSGSGVSGGARPI
jgi:hypothetical protein